MAKSSLSEASDCLYKYLYKNKKKLTQDEEFILYTHASVVEFIEYNQYMFNKNIKKMNKTV